MAFDIPYIIQRIKNLGYKPEDIMTHPDFKFKNATYYIDERNKDHLKNVETKPILVHILYF